MKLFYFLMALALIPLEAQAMPPVWTIDAAHSTLAFDGTEMGAPFTGDFKTFGGEIVFDAANLAQSHAAITVGTTSAESQNDDANKYMSAPDWLNTAAFPQAKFTATKFEKTGDNAFIAHGLLSLRGIAMPVDLPFTLTFLPDGKTAVMKGETTLDRLAFKIGASGEYNNPKTVGLQVKVLVTLTATRQGP